MASVNLGRVAMVHRGDYNLLFEYKPLDCCYHQGSTYLCKAESVGNAPPNADYWVLMSTSASTVDREAAEAAALEALGYKNQAAAQVDLAADQVALAAEHVETAAGHVTAAQGKVDLAAAQVALAEQHAVAAGTSETNAATSETNAANSATAASTSETNAAASATSAAGSASAAAISAASVDGPGLYNAIATHDHSGAVGMGAPIDYEHLTGAPPCPYEVGDILTTLNIASPAVRWPGTVWAALGGRMLIGVDGTYTAGSTGGEATHNHGLSTAYVKIRISQYNIFGSSEDQIACPGYDGYYSNSGMTSGTDMTGTKVNGSTDSGSSLPPYLAVYMWERTA